MYKTIKSKIIIITLIMLILISVTTSGMVCLSFFQSKRVKLQSCDLLVGYFAEKINKSILQLQKNALDLSLMGEIFYNAGNFNKKLLDKTMVSNFSHDDIAIGGGIWFKPYLINPKSKRYSSYAYDLGDKGVFIEKDIDGDAYDYLNQSWYTSIIGHVNKNNVIWTKPYFDETSAHALMTTAGAGMFDNKNNLIGLATVDWGLEDIIKEISSMKPTKNSFALFADKNSDFVIATNDTTLKENMLGKSLEKISWYKDNLLNKSKMKYNNIEYISFVRNLDNGLILIINVPTNELFSTQLKRLGISLFLLFVTCITISSIMYSMMKNNIKKPIDDLTKQTSEIGAGDLDKEIEIDEPEEFVMLANAFNKMTKNIKEQITELNIAHAQQAKMESELNIAKAIQYSVLPNRFPPYPDNKEFDIFANMVTAKEVGGDFYDFFFIDSTHFAFLIADVSGKGIPAALFMMTTKTMLKNLAKTHLSPEKLMTTLNRKICKTNQQGLFVTIFLCVIDLSSGKLISVNAGHNPPLIKRSNGNFEYFKCKPNLVVGAMEDIKYEYIEDKLEANDSIFMYTDGVTEAFDIQGNLYGENKLLETINGIENSEQDIKKIILNIKEDVNNFSIGTEQADDITMLMFKYNGAKMINNNFESIEIKKLPAKLEFLDTVSSWITKSCDKFNLPQDILMKLNLAVEEIFVNISTYAYPPKEGEVEITFKINNDKITIQFMDNGTQYNPLEKPDPDITLSIEDRPIGGLGLFMVKQSMSSMEYEYKDGKNILILTINL